MFQKLLKRMYKNESIEGSITLKINVDMKYDFVIGEDGETQRVDK